MEEIITALITEKNSASRISAVLPFPAHTLNLELKAASVSPTNNTNLHLDTQILQTEIVHEQLNKIADAIRNMHRLVSNMNHL